MKSNGYRECQYNCYVFPAGSEFEEDLEILEEAALQVCCNVLKHIITLKPFDCYRRKSLVRFL